MSVLAFWKSIKWISTHFWKGYSRRINHFPSCLKPAKQGNIGSAEWPRIPTLGSIRLNWLLFVQIGHTPAAMIHQSSFPNDLAFLHRKYVRKAINITEFTPSHQQANQEPEGDWILRARLFDRHITTNPTLLYHIGAYSSGSYGVQAKSILAEFPVPTQLKSVPFQGIHASSWQNGAAIIGVLSNTRPLGSRKGEAASLSGSVYEHLAKYYDEIFVAWARLWFRIRELRTVNLGQKGSNRSKAMIPIWKNLELSKRISSESARKKYIMELRVRCQINVGEQWKKKSRLSIPKSS